MTPPQFPLVAALVAIAAGLVAVALLGPLTGGPIEYHVSETLRNQTIGLDATSLFVVAPLAVAAAVLARSGHVAGPALALGVGAYTAYMFVQYIVGPEYLARPGDNEASFRCTFVCSCSAGAARCSRGRRSPPSPARVRADATGSSAGWCSRCSRSWRSRATCPRSPTP